jgi:hypothetical protein
MKTYDENGVGEVRSPGAHHPEHESPSKLPLVVSRQAEPEAVLDLQRTAGNAAVVQLLAEGRQDEAQQEHGGRSPVLDVVGRGGGQPLDPLTRTTMESGLGADFSDVRVHTDGAASSSAAAVQAHAYTVGNEVVFQAGRYQPETPAGQRMLAHELTHVVQQRSGPVDGTPSGGGISLSDPSDRFEQAAEDKASRFASSAHNPSPEPVGAGRAAPAIERSGEGEDDQAVQGLFIQRAEEGEKEEEPVQGSFVQREGEEDKMEDETG